MSAAAGRGAAQPLPGVHARSTTTSTWSMTAPQRLHCVSTGHPFRIGGPGSTAARRSAAPAGPQGPPWSRAAAGGRAAARSALDDGEGGSATRGRDRPRSGPGVSAREARSSSGAGGAPRREAAPDMGAAGSSNPLRAPLPKGRHPPAGHRHPGHPQRDQAVSASPARDSARDRTAARGSWSPLHRCRAPPDWRGSETPATGCPRGLAGYRRACSSGRNGR